MRYKAMKRTGMKRSKKKTGRQTLNKQADILWSMCVKKQDKHRCAYCGKADYLNSHHIFSRSNFATRWMVANGICLCSGCHTLSSKFSAHKTPAEFIEWVKVKRGLEWYETLRADAKKVSAHTIEELEAIINNLNYLLNG